MKYIPAEKTACFGNNVSFDYRSRGPHLVILQTPLNMKVAEPFVNLVYIWNVNVIILSVLGEESTEHTSSAQVSATDTHALPPANDGEGHSTLFCIKLPETLADSCLVCCVVSTVVHISGVAKGGPGRACAQPKHRVRPTHVTQSRMKRTRA